MIINRKTYERKSTMKMLKKTLALVLALTMLFALCVPALAAEGEESEDNVFHYVSLGASNSNGYALHGYLTEDMYANPILSGAQTGTPGDISGYRSTPPYSYPALVRDYFAELGYEVDHDQLAQSSMRVEELRFLLDPEFTTDEYMEWRFYDPNDSWTWWYSNLDELRADYKQSITEADLITYDMGLNNFGVYLTNNLLSDSYGNDLHYVIPDKYADMYYDIRAKIESGIISLGILDQGTFDTLDNLTDTIAYAILGYCINFDATIGIIREWNPDATLVVLNVQNIMAGLKASIAGIELPLGEIIGVATKIANTYTSLLSPYADEYLYADTTENGRVTCFMDQLLEYNGDPATLDQDMRECLDVYDTSLPMYLKFRVAARIAASMGDPLATQALTNKNVLKNNLPYFVEFCEANCPELYAQTMENAYDVIMTLLQAGIATNPVSVDGILAGADTGDLEDILVDGIYDLINRVTDANINGGGFTDEDIQTAIDTLLCDDNMKAVAAIGVRASIGNTFFSHPNRQGCRELFDAIINALENNITGSEVFMDGLSKAAKNIIDNTVEFGAQFPALLLGKIADAFGIDGSGISELAKKFVNVDMIEDVLYNELHINSLEKLAKLAGLITGVRSELSVETGLPFTDVAADAWYYDGVEYCYENGIMQGTSETRFSPSATVSRAQMVTILYRMAGSPDVSGLEEPFLDVSDSHWAHDAIVWAYNEGVATGFANFLFAPGLYVSRGQMVTMLYRYAGSPEVSGELGFEDAKLIPNAFKDAIIWASENGVVNGYENGFFNSALNLTRGQMAVIISRYCTNF